MKNLLLIVLLAVVLTALTSCGLTWEGAIDTTAESVLRDMVNRGVISEDQYGQLIEAYRGGGVRSLLGDAADIAIAGVLGYFGVKNAPKLFGRKQVVPTATPAKK